MTSPYVVPFSFAKAKENTREKVIEEIFVGLGKGEFGFLLGPPNLGKSNLSLSLCYEAVTATRIIGLIPDHAKPKKVLYVPYEDKLANTNTRITSHSSVLSETQCQLIEENFAYYNNFSPLLGVFGNQPKAEDLYQPVKDLIEAAKDFDLVVLDTARGLLGSWDEVKGDSLFRQTMNDIASKGDVAILINHHLTKVQSGNLDEVNSTGGSGLSTSQSESKFHIFLYTDKPKAHEKTGQLRLKHTKYNYIKPDKAFTSANPITISKHDNLLINANVFEKEDTIIEPSTAQKTMLRDRFVSRMQDEVGDVEVDEEVMNNVLTEASKKPTVVDSDIFDVVFMGEEKR
ncbi:AAA family ATPase [Vibrio owensii]|uniref:Uncharacterized protein n=1 Tax=Vibrio owensii CAIM 1854 = LMG 25443 TaxID=1229493 RepID=A0A0C1ZJQ1_9VIBR|nr:AAA family ATPase [Vibrio owensii]KIF53381.1 hypothetical protein H735_10705 [Vibrio owensii CAIM 1854 = LMG 25443]